MPDQLVPEFHLAVANGHILYREESLTFDTNAYNNWLLPFKPILIDSSEPTSFCIREADLQTSGSQRHPMYNEQNLLRSLPSTLISIR